MKGSNTLMLLVAAAALALPLVTAAGMGAAGAAGTRSPRPAAVLARRMLAGPAAPNGSSMPAPPPDGGASASADAGTAPSSLLDAPVTRLSGRNATLVYTSAIAAAAANATGDAAAAPPAQTDPDPYIYPLPLVAAPTVFFTAQLPAAGGVESFSPAVRAAFAAAVAAFLDPTGAGRGGAEVQVLAVQKAVAGLWVPAAATFVADEDGSLRALLVSTLQSDANFVFPSAAWGVVRAANIQEAAPATPEPVTFAWLPGEYGKCSALCGGGWQARLGARNLSCISSLGVEAPPSACPSPPPPSNRTCHEQDCRGSGPSGFSLSFGPWSACDAACGPSKRLRSVTCASREGYLAQLTSCTADPAALAPLLWEPCPDAPPCPRYVWTYGDWVCDDPAGCGGGTATRSAVCRPSTGGAEVEASRCAAEELEATSQPCATRACDSYYWRPRELGDCMPADPAAPCGRWVQPRRFDCVLQSTQEVVAARFCTEERPYLDTECPPPPECEAVAAGEGGADTSAGAGAPAEAPASSGESTAAGSSGELPPIELPEAAAAGPEPAASAPVSEASSPEVSEVQAGSQFARSGGKAGSPPLSSPAASEAAGATSASTRQTPPPSPEAAAAAVVSGAGGGGGVSRAATARGPSGAMLTGTAAAGSTATASNPSGTSSAVALVQGMSGWGPKLGAAAAATTAGAGSGGNSSTADPGVSASSGDSGSGSSGSSGSGTAEMMAPAPAGDGGSDDDRVAAAGNTTARALACPEGVAIDLLGNCCSGTALDGKGRCCDGAVDACGVCNGTGVALDAHHACCAGRLDAQGVCCPPDSLLDECGVCNGTAACPARLQLVARVPRPGLYLSPNSNPNKRLRAALSEAFAAALSVVQRGTPFNHALVTATFSAAGGGSEAAAAPVGKSRRARAAVQRAGSAGSFSGDLAGGEAAGEAGDGGDGDGGGDGGPLQGGSGGGLTPFNSTALEEEAGPLLIDVVLRGNSSGGTSPPNTAAALIAAFDLVGRGLPVPGASAARLRFVRLAAALRVGTCGDGVCEVGERVATDSGGDGCPEDCPFPFLSCPPFASGGAVAANGSAAGRPPPCNGHGACFSPLGACSCFDGYAGDDCSACARGFTRVGAFCVSTPRPPKPRAGDCPGPGCPDQPEEPASRAGVAAAAVAAAAAARARELRAQQAALTAVASGTVALAAAVAAFVYRARRVQQLKLYRTMLASAQTAAE
ncbi:hypothetical protein Rsub_08616 [Raphidocelis subcapitata]|uniref:EGF-like domain-containing protein n=1 Tax=Raphidocelis subcapitata TaxID=307507 RepID=A0A2V0P6Y5_9CHLO|nr:hypothetical protein Rsub_08616 [Raphidocelis subcapitata]|eukprot:GBF95634.1 hypothetical protein Rsub_08616 [Raphidocelis subcapitata]